MSRSAEAVEAGTVHIRSSNSKIAHGEEATGSLEQKTSDCSAEKRKSLRARYFYGIIFLVINLIAWFMRDYGQKYLPQLQYLKACGAEGDDCFHTLGVLRVSLGCFDIFYLLLVFLEEQDSLPFGWDTILLIFFFLMFLSTFNTSKLYEVRSNWHSGWWALKFILLVISIGLPFFFPSNHIQLYGEFARVGAGIFLVLQLVSVIEFIAWWNNYWMPDQEAKQSCSLGLFFSTIFYIASIFGIALMYYLYAPRLSCSLNIFFITWTAILLIVMMVISLHSTVNRGLLSSGIVASYLVFLCWSAIRSEPANMKCSTQKQVNGNSDWTTILGFLIAICAIVMATFSTGIDSQSFQFRKEKVQREDDIPYKYGFFQLVFSLGAMYFAMLFISWNLDNSAGKWSIDVGWTSTWVKVVNEWFAATIYLWKFLSPIVGQPKVLDHEEPMHQRDDSTLP